MDRLQLPRVDTHEAKELLQEIGSLFYDFGWSLGTSSNYSLVLSHKPLRLLITASGKDKGNLIEDDFVEIDGEGKKIGGGSGKPSAETMIHVVLAENPDVGSVLHTHSLWGTVLSDRYFEEGGFYIDGYEMLKGLEGNKTHEHKEWVKIFDNTQDIPDLAKRVKDYLTNDPQGKNCHGFLIRKHGLYTWGKDIDEARRHIEIYEFLFEVLGHSGKTGK